MTDDYQTIIVEHRSNVGLLTLNRPQRLNALNNILIEECLDAIDKLINREQVRCLLVTGNGRAFCAGADLAATDSWSPSLGTIMKRGTNPLILALHNASCPVIAAVNGTAAGGGFGLALAADFVLMANSATFILPFARIGLGLDMGTSWFLPQLLGTKRATAISMLCEPISSEKALEWGLAWQVLEEDKLMGAALALAERLAAGPTRAYAAQKQQLRDANCLSLEQVLDREADLQDLMIETEDAQEGITAFLEKREAQYQGR